MPIIADIADAGIRERGNAVRRVVDALADVVTHTDGINKITGADGRDSIGGAGGLTAMIRRLRR